MKSLGPEMLLTFPTVTQLVSGKAQVQPDFGFKGCAPSKSQPILPTTDKMGLEEGDVFYLFGETASEQEMSSPQ